MQKKISQVIHENISIKNLILEDAKLIKTIEVVTRVCIDALKSDKKILLCGNGGSAADAQHLAAEFSGRFYKDRDPLFAEALHINTSYLTAVANDYSYEQIYSRLVKAKGRERDVLIGISTSGNSLNVIKAFQQGKKQGMINIAMTGQNGGGMALECHHLLNMPSTDTPRIQEAHILVGHIICEIVELELFK